MVRVFVRCRIAWRCTGCGIHLTGASRANVADHANAHVKKHQDSDHWAAAAVDAGHRVLVGSFVSDVQVNLGVPETPDDMVTS